MFLPGHYVDPAINYENTAKAWADTLEKSFPNGSDAYEVTMCIELMKTLWRDISNETLEAIELDPLSFSDRVNDYLYANAMKTAEEY